MYGDGRIAVGGAPRGRVNPHISLERKDEMVCNRLLGLLKENQREAVDFVLLAGEPVDLENAARELRMDQRTLKNLLQEALQVAKRAVDSNPSLQGQGIRRKLNSLTASLNRLISPTESKTLRRQ